MLSDRWLGSYTVFVEPLALLAAVLIAFSPGLHVPFQGGDFGAIVSNPSLRGTWLQALNYWPQAPVVVLGRPVLNLSFALNYHLGGLSVAGYHVANLCIHGLAALALYGALGLTPKVDRFAAWCVALLWAVHPMQSGAVTYISGRAESLTGLCALLCLYGFLRGARGGSRVWLIAAVLVCGVGMGVCQDMAATPFVLMLYDRTFLSRSWRELLSRRGLWHALFLLTLVPLWWLNNRTHDRMGTYGFGVMPWLRYAGAQYPAFLHYLRLAMWPAGIVWDEGNRYVSSFWQVLPGLVVFGVFTAAALSTFRRPTAVSFLATAVLELLETTCVIPDTHATTVEYRMYLALAPLVVGFVWLLFRALGRRRGQLAALALAAVLGTITRSQTPAGPQRINSFVPRLFSPSPTAHRPQIRSIPPTKLHRLSIPDGGNETPGAHVGFGGRSGVRIGKILGLDALGPTVLANHESHD